MALPHQKLRVSLCGPFYSLALEIYVAQTALKLKMLFFSASCMPMSPNQAVDFCSSFFTFIFSFVEKIRFSHIIYEVIVSLPSTYPSSSPNLNPLTSCLLVESKQASKR